VKQALRPVLASARVPKFSWASGEVFTAELFLLNDSPDPVPAGSVEAWLHNSEGFKTRIFRWDHPGGAANTNLTGPTLSITLPDLINGRLGLFLRVPGNPDWDSEYNFQSVTRS